MTVDSDQGTGNMEQEPVERQRTDVVWQDTSTENNGQMTVTVNGTRGTCVKGQGTLTISNKKGTRTSKRETINRSQWGP